MTSIFSGPFDFTTVGTLNNNYIFSLHNNEVIYGHVHSNIIWILDEKDLLDEE